MRVSWSIGSPAQLVTPLSKDLSGAHPVARWRRRGRWAGTIEEAVKECPRQSHTCIIDLTCWIGSTVALDAPDGDGVFSSSAVEDAFHGRIWIRNLETDTGTVAGSQKPAKLL